MIQANELRIGNYILADTIGLFMPHMVTAVDILDIQNKKLPCEIRPIPLSPDVLERCMTKVSNKEFKIEVPVEWSKTHHTGYWFIVKWYEYIATG